MGSAKIKGSRSTMLRWKLLSKSGTAAAVALALQGELVRIVFYPAQRIYELHLFDGIARNIKKARTCKDHRQGSRPTNRYIEAIATVEEFNIARYVVARGGRHGDQNGRALLALKLVHGADTSVLGENI